MHDASGTLHCRGAEAFLLQMQRKAAAFYSMHYVVAHVHAHNVVLSDLVRYAPRRLCRAICSFILLL